MRVYRDTIAAAIILFVVGAVAGIFLRVIQPAATRLRTLLPFCILGSIFLPAWWFLREDSYWLAPLIIIGLVLAILFLFTKKRGGLHRRTLARIGLLILPVLITVMCGLGVATLNKTYYKRFVVNDYTSTDFGDAYGALTRVEHDNFIMDVPVSEDARLKIYEVSPAFAELQPFLDNDGQGSCEGWKMYPDGSVFDFRGGWFFWALRDAVAEAGYYRDAAAAEEYYTRLAAEVNAACDDGRLPAWAGKRSELMPPFHSEYLEPTIDKTMEGLRFLIGYQNIHYGTEGADAIMEMQQKAEKYIRGEGYYPPPPSVKLTFEIAPAAEAADSTPVQIQLAGPSGELYGEPYEVSVGIPQHIWVEMPIDPATFESPAGYAAYSIVLTDASGGVETIPLAGPGQPARIDGDRHLIDMTITDTRINTFTPFEKTIRTIQEGVLAVYQFLVPIAFVVSLLLLGASVVFSLIRHRRVAYAGAAVFALGLLLTILLRAAMLAFVTASSFFSISVLYFSSTYPLLLVFIALGLTVGIRTIHDEWQGKKSADKPATLAPQNGVIYKKQ